MSNGALTPDAIEAEALKQAAKRKVAAALWHRGSLEWKLEAHQLEVHKQFKEAAKIPNSRFVLNASRRWGKTYALVLYAIEFALTHPGAAILYCGSTQKAVKDYILPTLLSICSDCPDAIRPKVKTQTNTIQFHNGAWIKISGIDGGRLQKMRGITAHLVLIDEAGFVDQLANAVRSVLFPMTTSTGGQMILSSNAPLTPGHDFVQVFTREAQEASLYCQQTIYDVKKYTHEDIDRFAASCGGYGSSDFKREYLCQFVIDEANAVLPEWTLHKAKLTKEVLLPEFFNPLVSIDLGMVDFTGVLFGYYHFALGQIVIEDELLLRGTNSAKLARACKDKEAALWKEPLKTPIRVCDGPAFTINDIATLHGYPVGTVSKEGTLESMVNAIRLDVQAERILVHPRCKNLLGQMEDAIWNKQRTEFARDAKNGHFDLIAALQYFIRHVNRHSNPFPPNYKMNPREMVIKDSKFQNKGYDQLKKMFGTRRWE